MKKLLIIMAAGAWFASCSTVSSKEKEGLSQAEKIERGKYLVTIGGCHDCHTPKIFGPQGPALDTNRLLSGYREGSPLPPYDSTIAKSGWALMGMEGTSMVSPLGVSFAANITSDQTGIGNWSFEQFKKAFTKGRYKGLDNTRPLLPPMPWENYKHMAEEDVESIFLYLKSTTPVRNVVPAAKIQ
jgi:hypothetical protein